MANGDTLDFSGLTGTATSDPFAMQSAVLSNTSPWQGVGTSAGSGILNWLNQHTGGFLGSLGPTAANHDWTQPGGGTSTTTAAAPGLGSGAGAQGANIPPPSPTRGEAMQGPPSTYHPGSPTSGIGNAMQDLMQMRAWKGLLGI